MPASLLLTRSNRPFPRKLRQASKVFLRARCRMSHGTIDCAKNCLCAGSLTYFFCEVHLVPKLEFQTQGTDRTTTDEVLTISKIRPHPQLFSPSITGPPPIPLEEIIALAFPFSAKTDRQTPLFYFLPPSPFVVKTPGSSSFSPSTFPTFVVFPPSSFLPPFDPLPPLPQRAKTFTTLPFPPSLRIEARGEVVP